MSIENIEIDHLDKKIIDVLREDASLTNNEIAKKIDLSPSATLERIRKLHNNRIIRKISAFISGYAIDKDMCAFIYVLIDTPTHSRNFLNAMMSHPSIMECHHITGEYSYLLKVRVKNTHELETFITDSLKTNFGIVRTLTQIVLSSPKDGDTIID
jgi:Lrp/AsnC family leucine-responsive transcriptional regulator